MYICIYIYIYLYICICTDVYVNLFIGSKNDLILKRLGMSALTQIIDDMTELRSIVMRLLMKVGVPLSGRPIGETLKRQQELALPPPQ